MTDEQVLVVDVDTANQYLEQGGWRVVNVVLGEMGTTFICIAKKTRLASTGPR